MDPPEALRTDTLKIDSMTEQNIGLKNASVFIMTLNEEINIASCLRSVSWSNDIVILDSYSKDQTIEIASKFPNVRIYFRKFDNYSNQRNYALRNIKYKNNWLLVLDADEIVEPKLTKEIINLVQDTGLNNNVYLLRRKLIFNNKWLRWNTSANVWVERLIRPEAVRYRGIVHEKLVFQGSHGYLSGRLEHHQFTKGIKDWISRRCNYAKLEDNENEISANFANLLSPNVIQRRVALKTIFNIFPGKWMIYLLFNIIFKLSFLDGVSGIYYICLESYLYYITDKSRKNRAQSKRGSKCLNT